MEKKLLIISYSFPPSAAPAAQRPYYFAKFLSKNEGVDVTVITPQNADSSLGYGYAIDFNTVPFNVVFTKSTDLSQLRKIKNEGIKKEGNIDTKGSLKGQVKKSIIKVFKKVSYPDKAITWLPYALKAAIRAVKKEGNIYVYTTSPLWTNHLIGLYLKIFYNTKWIIDIRDYHYLENYEFSKAFRRNFDHFFERLILKKANEVLFISNSMRNEYTKKYPFISNKTNAIYNGFSLEEYRGRHPAKITNKKLSIFYAGSFYKGVRSPKPLLLALEYLFEQGKIMPDEIEIKIAGNFENSLIPDLKHLKAFNCIDFLGLIPRDEVLSIAMNTHLLWLIVGERVSHYTGFPVKGYEYIGARRPTLVFTKEESEPQRIVESLNAGKRLSNSITEEEIISNAGILLEYYKLFQSGQLDEPLKYNTQNINQYLRDHQASQFAKLIK